MSAELPVARDSVERQVEMFVLFVGPGRHIKRSKLSQDTGIPESTLRDWATGATMPLWAVNALCPHLPPEAINLLFAPAGRHLVAAEKVETDFDGLAASAASLAAEICRARQDGKIDHVEAATICKSTRALIAQAEAVVSH